MASHAIMGGKVHVYKRGRSRFWQCSTYLAGKNHRVSTKEESLGKAKEVAEDWYIELRGKHNRGELKTEKTFKEAAAQFLREYEVITEGQRHPAYVEGHERRLKLHLIPFFGDKGLSEITPGLVQEYRIHRKNPETSPRGKPPSRSTMHHELVTLRQTIKTAIRHGWLQHLPDFSQPYRTAGKITHRAWFAPEEYKTLYEASRARVRRNQGTGRQWASEQLHDYILFMANTGLRPDEANTLEFRDVKIVEDDATDETILLIEVRGKRGVGYCKSMKNAVRPFQRLLERPRPVYYSETDEDSQDGADGEVDPEREMRLPQPTDLVFPANHKKQFNAILVENKLKFDRDGNRRTAYSLRHTYICLRLLEGADIYQIAKNCRTSVEMIEKYYASHISTTLDAAAINVRRPKKRKEKQTEGEKGPAPSEHRVSDGIEREQTMYGSDTEKTKTSTANTGR